MAAYTGSMEYFWNACMPASERCHEFDINSAPEERSLAVHFSRSAGSYL